MQVREATPEDAAAVIVFFQRLYSETSFMLFEPGEAVPSENEQAQRIEHATKTESGAMFLCETGNRIIGACFGTRDIAKRTRHSLHVVAGVLQAWVGRGVGRLLLQQLENWARSHGLHRLELTVQVENHRAIALYEKLGFEREGVRRHSLNIEGKFADEFCMSKLITV